MKLIFIKILLVWALLWTGTTCSMAQGYERPDKPPPTTVTPWVGASGTRYGYAIGGGLSFQRSDTYPLLVGVRYIPLASVTNSWPSWRRIEPLDWTHHFGLWVRKDWDWAKQPLPPNFNTGITGMYSYGRVYGSDVNIFEILPHLSYQLSEGRIKTKISGHLGINIMANKIEALPTPIRIFEVEGDLGLQLLFFLDLKKKETIEE